MNRKHFLKTLSLAPLAPGFALDLLSRERDIPLVNSEAHYMRQDTDFHIQKVKTYMLKKALFVRVKLNNGMKGWAEAMPNDKRASRTLIDKTLENYYEGTSIFDAEKTWNHTIGAEYDLGPGGLLTYSIAGIDCACWDLIGKIKKEPVYQLLGGKKRNEIPVYASFTRDQYPEPKLAADRARYLVNEGYQTLKFRMRWGLENQDPENDTTLAFAESLRKAIGPDINLVMDANMGHSRKRAIELGNQLEKYQLMWWEEPTAPYDYETIKAVSEAIKTPVVFGEHAYTVDQVRHLCTYGKVWAINPDLLKCGGFTGGRQISNWAETNNMKIAAHNSRPSLSTVCMLHWVSSTAATADLPQEYAHREKAPQAYDTVINYPQFSNGQFTLSNRPGLGVDIDEDQVKFLDKKYS